MAGNDNVGINVDPSDIRGDRNTFVRPDPGSTNTVLNRGGVAVGFRATADSSSIAIGSGAMAGDQAFVLRQLQELDEILSRSGHSDGSDATRALIEDVTSPGANRSAKAVLWAAVERAAQVAGVVDLAYRIKDGLTLLNYFK